MKVRCYKPWQAVLSRIKARCTNPKTQRYKYYGGKGIKCLISSDELKFLWIRDKADKLKRPSIDRIDSNKNYEIENCRFIELSENSSRGKHKTHCKYGHALTGWNVKKKKCGGRQCRTCVYDFQKKRYHAKKASIRALNNEKGE